MQIGASTSPASSIHHQGADCSRDKPQAFSPELAQQLAAMLAQQIPPELAQQLAPFLSPQSLDQPPQPRTPDAVTGSQPSHPARIAHGSAGGAQHRAPPGMTGYTVSPEVQGNGPPGYAHAQPRHAMSRPYSAGPHGHPSSAPAHRYNPVGASRPHMPAHTTNSPSTAPPGFPGARQAYAQPPHAPYPSERPQDAYPSNVTLPTGRRMPPGFAPAGHSAPPGFKKQPEKSPASTSVSWRASEQPLAMTSPGPHIEASTAAPGAPPNPNAYVPPHLRNASSQQVPLSTH